MTSIGDESLLDKLQNSNVEPAAKLVTGLRNRSLWKCVFERSRHDVIAEQQRAQNVDVWEMTMKSWWKNPDGRTADEDGISALLGLESGDVLIHCPDQEMAMKLAKMKVFWNGSLKPLKECKDDPIVSGRLQQILDSHEILWSIRVFVNPEHLDKGDAVFNASQYLFTFDNEKKARYGKLFFTEVVDAVTKDGGLQNGLNASEYKKRAEIAVTKILENDEPLRSIENVKDLIRNEFKKK